MATASTAAGRLVTGTETRRRMGIMVVMMRRRRMITHTMIHMAMMLKIRAVIRDRRRRISKERLLRTC